MWYTVRASVHREVKLFDFRIVLGFFDKNRFFFSCVHLKFASDSTEIVHSTEEGQKTFQSENLLFRFGSPFRAKIFEGVKYGEGCYPKLKLAPNDRGCNLSFGADEMGTVYNKSNLSPTPVVNAIPAPTVARMGAEACLVAKSALSSFAETQLPACA